jgi:YfiH family protein
MIHSVPWSTPPNVKAYFTCRQGGSSEGEYAGFNLGDHVGDAAEHVAANRRALTDAAGGLEQVQWLEQVHGVRVLEITGFAAVPPKADASITRLDHIACAVMTADCLPILLCDKNGNQVAAVHAGWRGLCAGIVANSVAAFDVAPEDISAWIGPAISQRCFEVGAEVRAQFLDEFDLPKNVIESHFLPSAKVGRKMADLPSLAAAQLEALGLQNIGKSAVCTFADAARFYSYRRDGQTGRFACFIYKN